MNDLYDEDYESLFGSDEALDANLDALDSNSEDSATDLLSYPLDQVRKALDTLTERETGIIEMRLGLDDGQPKNLEEIGKVYGVTRERIRQLEAKALSKLRHASRLGIGIEWQADGTPRLQN